VQWQMRARPTLTRLIRNFRPEHNQHMPRSYAVTTEVNAVTSSRLEATGRAGAPRTSHWASLRTVMAELRRLGHPPSDHRSARHGSRPHSRPEAAERKRPQR
jgi:hypothetical protein